MPKKTKTDSELELVEYTDERDRPLGVTPLREARRQSLPHRRVAVLVYGQDKKLYLKKRGQEQRLYPGRFDLSASGHVRPGESRLDAAERRLGDALGLRADDFRLVLEAPASKETGFARVALFVAVRIKWEPNAARRAHQEDGVFVDRAELQRLVENFRELLTPALVYFHETGALFPQA